MGINVKWDITYKCNLNCAHCINGNFLGKLEDELSTGQVLKVVEKLKEAGVDYVHILGGEPTAREDICEIFDEFQEKNIDFGFNTNGLKLTKKDFREKIVKNNNLKNIVFSLEGPAAEINDSIRGKKVFEVTTQNIKEIVLLKERYNRQDLKLTINTVVSKINLIYIRDMIYFCRDIGANECVLLQFIPEGNGKELEGTINIEEELKLIEEVAQCYKELKDELEIRPRFTFPLAQKYAEKVLKSEFPETFNVCGAGENFFYLNNKGELYPCDRYRERISSLYAKHDIRLEEKNFWDIASQNGYEEIFEISEGKETYQLCEPCVRCEFLGKNCYPCPAQMMEGKEMKMATCEKMMEEIKNA